MAAVLPPAPPPSLAALLSLEEARFPHILDNLYVRAPRDRPPERRAPVGRVTLGEPVDLRQTPAFVQSGLILGPVTPVILAEFRAALDTSVPRLCNRHFNGPEVEKRRGDLVHYFDSIWVVRGHNGQRLILHQDVVNLNLFIPLAFFADGGEGHHHYVLTLQRLEDSWYLIKEAM